MRNCFTCQTRDRTEWCALSDDELKLLDQGKMSREYLPGEVIYREGDPFTGVFCVESGLVGAWKVDAGGNEVLLRLSHPGDTVGYRSFLSGDDRHNTTEAMEPSIICFIATQTVRSLVDHNPTLGLRFLQHATRDLDAAEEKVLQNAALTVRARFAHLLLVLKDRYAVDDENDGLIMNLPLSRQDLAAMIGTRPESMSRAIRSLEDDNVAHFSGRRVHVPRVGILLQELEIPNSP